MKNLLFIIVLAFASVTLSAQKLTLDPYHAKLQFKVVHMTISNVDGEFKKFDVQLDYTNEDFSDAKFTILAETKSIDTGVEARDNHLRSADFFDVEKYPNLKFVTTSFVKVSKSRYLLIGDLSLHGVSKPVSLKVKYNGNVIDPTSNKKVYGFTVAGSIKRSDFGIGTDFPEMVISDEVRIRSNLEFIAE